MEKVYNVELERLKLQMPAELEFDHEIIYRFQVVFDGYKDKSREKYIQRLQLEFPKFTRTQLNQLDDFFDAKRWSGQKQNAIIREWAKEKSELK